MNGEVCRDEWGAGVSWGMEVSGGVEASVKMGVEVSKECGGMCVCTYTYICICISSVCMGIKACEHM